MEIKQEQPQNFQMECPVKIPLHVGLRSFEQSHKTIDKFNDFISKLILSERQNEIAYRLAEELIKIHTDVEINFEQSIEDSEVLFVFSNEKGINFISIDMDGDVMISITPYEGQGDRFFQNNDGIDAEFAVYKLLSLI